MSWHISSAGAAVILNALRGAMGDARHTFFADGVPTSVQAFFNVHGHDLEGLLAGMAEERTQTSVPNAYDVLQIAHRIDVSGSADAPALRRLADWMIAQASPPSPVSMGVDFAEGVTIDAEESLKALGDYMLELHKAYAATASGLFIQRDMERVGLWLKTVSSHHATAQVGRIKPFPVHGMQLAMEVGHG
ncbi:hypothetical protein [Lysobacter brunescens]|uniref:Uncharacterized protein n=1 Tax=Lysobacter brunescens TaxID=262323 RepID=A0ABW2YG56_9GAMM